MSRRLWTREELVKALSLYCQIPFGRMHSSTPEVIELADRIDRTPSAVALKLVNFASLDPEHQSRGVSGMSNTSAADRAVWEEFYERWDILAEEFSAADDATASDVRTSYRLSTATETQTLGSVLHRRGQAFFRASVLAAHNEQCCITGISEKSLLRASHIVPWATDVALRLNPRNGLCLNVLHDAAFDRGLITLSDKLELRLSSRLRAGIPNPVYTKMFLDYSGCTITHPARHAPSSQFLEHHRNHIFCP